MNSFISINSITLSKLLNRYKFTLRVKQEIIKEAHKKFTTWFGLNGVARKLSLKSLLQI